MRVVVKKSAECNLACVCVRTSMINDINVQLMKGTTDTAAIATQCRDRQQQQQH